MRGAIDVMPHRTTDTPQQTYDEAEAGRFSPSDGVVDAAATVRGEPPRQETRASRRSEPQVLGEAGSIRKCLDVKRIQRQARSFPPALSAAEEVRNRALGILRVAGDVGGDAPRREDGGPDVVHVSIGAHGHELPGGELQELAAEKQK